MLPPLTSYDTTSPSLLQLELQVKLPSEVRPPRLLAKVSVPVKSLPAGLLPTQTEMSASP